MRCTLLVASLLALPALAQPPLPRLVAPSTLPPVYGYAQRPVLLFGSLLPLQALPDVPRKDCQPRDAQRSGIDWQALPAYQPAYDPQRVQPTTYWLGW
ncbi:MAG: hypothetical protein Q7J29_08070 [Stagnimonas sp.]|nr:hypothetical protein [Stagnimonas sp.]